MDGEEITKKFVLLTGVLVERGDVAAWIKVGCIVDRDVLFFKSKLVL